MMYRSFLKFCGNLPAQKKNLWNYKNFNLEVEGDDIRDADLSIITKQYINSTCICEE